MSFTNKLSLWYLESKRALPWRETRDPYHIWLSEIMLQQTRVSQGLPYYIKFTCAFPTVYDLAHSDEEQVLKLWQGLGYYSRARNLHATAKEIAFKRSGIFPTSYKELLSLKGVGEYTASAIASICYDEPVAVVDGNVYRVLARYFGVHTPINSSEGIKEFKLLAKSVLDSENPGTYNQAIMEFGALQCTPQKPACVTCIFSNDCRGYLNEYVKELPVKIKKLKVKKRYFHYVFPVIQNTYTILQKRPGKGIWAHLYEFPLVELDKKSSLKEVQDALIEVGWTDFEKEAWTKLEFDKVHKLSHQHLVTQFFRVQLTESPKLKEDQQLIEIASLDDYPVPVLISNFMETLDL